MKARSSHKPPVVLTIAGFDPSSGAGVTADVKTIAAHNCYAVACITALTVQSTRGVRRVEPVPGRVVRATLEELARDLKIAAVKIGMLGSAEVARAVAGFLRRHKPRHVVVDPILKSSSGARLLEKDALTVLKRRLLPLATVVTPNIAEAQVLTGKGIKSAADMEAAAAPLHHAGARGVIITGGHLDPPVDLVSRGPGKPAVLLRGQKIKTRSTHGTGCAFSSALACQLALGKPLIDAARLAKKFVESALRHPPGIGKGTGPIM